MSHNKIYTYRSESQSVNSLVNDLDTNKNINLNPIYQRNIVWDDVHKSSYINSVMRGIACNNIIFSKEGAVRTCIDGKQRCTTLLEFRKNKAYVEFIDDDTRYYYGPTDKDVPKDKNNKVISDDMRNNFDDHIVHIITYVNLEYQQQAEIFDKIQHGIKLTDGETIVSKLCDAGTGLSVKEFCDKYKDHLKHHFNIKRNDHISYIIKMMYTILHNGKIASKKQYEEFIREYKSDEMTQTKLETDVVIKNLFTNWILNDKKILDCKLTTNELCIYNYIFYNDLIRKNKNFVEFSDSDHNNIISIVANTQQYIADNRIKKRSEIEKYIQVVLAKTYEISNKKASNDNQPLDNIPQVLAKKKKKKVIVESDDD